MRYARALLWLTIPGIDRWLEAFAIYSSVLLSSCPSRGWIYSLISSEGARKFPTVWHGICMTWNFTERAVKTFSLTGIKGKFNCTFAGVPKACSSLGHITNLYPFPQSTESPGPKSGDLRFKFNKGVPCTDTPCPCTHQCKNPGYTAAHPGEDHLNATRSGSQSKTSLSSHSSRGYHPN